MRAISGAAEVCVHRMVVPPVIPMGCMPTPSIAEACHSTSTYPDPLIRKQRPAVFKGAAHSTGMSAGRYSTQQRVRSACELLKAGANVTEAALGVGFQEPNYFSRAFRGVMGVSPKRYQMESRTQRSRD